MSSMFEFSTVFVKNCFSSRLKYALFTKLFPISLRDGRQNKSPSNLVCPAAQQAAQSSLYIIGYKLFTSLLPWISRRAEEKRECVLLFALMTYFLFAGCLLLLLPGLRSLSFSKGS